MGTIRFDIVKGPSAFGLMDMFLNAYNGNLDFVYFVIKRNEIKKRLVGVVIETIYHESGNDHSFGISGHLRQPILVHDGSINYSASKFEGFYDSYARTGFLTFEY